MAILPSLAKSMEEHVNMFLARGSIFVPDKYFVGLYGEYVESAVKTLEYETKSGWDKSKNTTITDISGKSMSDLPRMQLDTWLGDFYDKSSKMLDLKWAASTVVLPNPKATKETDAEGRVLDSSKGINYPIIKAVEGGSLKITIEENRSLMFYQFFNALMNQFFSPKYLRVKSSFHKLNAVVAVIGGEPDKSGGEGMGVNAYPIQIFEFNSIVLEEIPEITLTSGVSKSGQPLQYNLKFSTPNTFQRPFKTTFRDLRDLGSDGKFLDVDIAGDKNQLDGKRQYNKDAFEMTESEMAAARDQ